MDYLGDCVKTGKTVSTRPSSFEVRGLPERPRSLLHCSTGLVITTELRNCYTCRWLTNSVAKNPKVHHRTHNSPTTVLVLSQSNPIHTPQAYLPKIQPDPIFPPTPWSSEWSLSFGLSHQNLVHFSLISHARHMPCSPHSPRLDLNLSMVMFQSNFSVLWPIRILRLPVALNNPLTLVKY
jgi:hypothetical protein